MKVAIEHELKQQLETQKQLNKELSCICNKWFYEEVLKLKGKIFANGFWRDIGDGKLQNTKRIEENDELWAVANKWLLSNQGVEFGLDEIGEIKTWESKAQKTVIALRLEKLDSIIKDNQND